MKPGRYILTLLLTAAIVPCIYAYDFRLILRDEKTRTAMLDLLPYAADKRGNVLCAGEPQSTDSAYLFKGLPEQKVIIYIPADDNVFQIDLNERVDTVMTDYVPRIKNTTLQEVVVEGANQYITDEKTVFTPSKREKRAAQGGVSLLNLMAIPTITVNPMNESVTTTDGDGVSLFIDYLPATDQQVKGLRAMQVERVEIFDFPKDPRFRGARHVVNYVLVKYEYGGYTTISGNQKIIANSGNYNLTSRLTARKMLYDLGAGVNYSRSSKHNGSSAVYEYDFPELGTVTRYANTLSSLSKNIGGYVTGQATYQTNKMSILNRLGFTTSKIPDNYSSTYTYYSPALHPSTNAISQTDNSNYSLSWSGYYYWTLPKNMKLQIEPSAAYSHFKQNSDYIANENIITTHAKDNAWKYVFKSTLQKLWGNQAISTTILTSGYGNNTDYTGTNPYTANLYNIDAAAFIDAYLNFGGFWFQGGGKIGYSHTKVDNTQKDHVFPGYFFATGYRFNAKNSITFASEMSTFTIPLNKQTANTVYQNEIDAITGNPTLKTFTYNSVSLRYQWLPNNMFSAGFFGNFARQNHPVVSFYRPITGLNGNPYMLNSLENYGYLATLNYGVNGTLRLFNNSLVINGMISGSTVTRHGNHNDYKGTNLAFNMNATYYWKDFYCQVYYQYRNKDTQVESSYETPQYYLLALGWSNGNLNVNVNITNPFNSKWKSWSPTQISGNYRAYIQNYDAAYHRDFNIRVSYSFSYGKRINRGNEVGATSGAESAILQ